MYNKTLARVEATLDHYADHLPESSLTYQSIMREDGWSEIASYARIEGLKSLAEMLEDAEIVSFQMVG
ncbi:MAG: hypothetical protein OEY38_10460 [Gammaproteobacteria bacterium]|nr:hypothetical protein [Gammaproteobacteria bacterium]